MVPTSAPIAARLCKLLALLRRASHSHSRRTRLPPQGRAPGRVRDAREKPKDPYQPQIKQLRLQIKQLRLDLQQLNQQIGTARIQYQESAPFLPWGLRRLDRMVEAGRLWDPAQKRQQLQQEIKQLEQQLLSLQQQQLQWQQQQQ